MCGGGGGGISAFVMVDNASSSLLSFSCYLPSGSCHFLNTVKYEVLESIAFTLMILVCDLFVEQYESVRAAMCGKGNTNFVIHFTVFLQRG